MGYNKIILVVLSLTFSFTYCAYAQIQDSLEVDPMVWDNLLNFDHQYTNDDSINLRIAAPAPSSKKTKGSWKWWQNGNSNGNSINPSFSQSACNDYCNSQNFEIITGFDRYTNQSIPAGFADNAWTVTADPPSNNSNCGNTIEPRPAFTINKDIAWSQHTFGSGSYGWVSGYPSNSATCAGTYTFETTFCLSTDYANVSIDISVLADNGATIYLNNNLIGAQTGIEGFKIANRLAISNNNASLFNVGTNTIRVELYNEGFVTGLSFYGNIQVTDGCVQCCDNYGSITGIKILDTDGNGIISSGGDDPGAGITFNLVQGVTLVSTVQSDQNGLYSFNDVPPGTYDVEEVLGSTYCPLLPQTGSYTGIEVDPFESISGVNFLNGDCIDPIANECESCIGSFAPIPAGQYLIGAWAKEENALPTKTSYDFPQLSVICDVSSSITPVTFGPYSPQGVIIDGWQRIEERIDIPADAINIQIVLSSSSGNVYYDDIRMFPFDASMKSYVYDPINMRLAAELDERHYATYYEYDEEGKLVRIKKETEKGVMTIQETKSNTAK